MNRLTESILSQSKIIKKPLANESLDDLRNSVDSLRNNTDTLRNIYLQEIPPILYNALKLSVLDKQYIPRLSYKLEDSDNIFNDINRSIGSQFKNYEEIRISLNEDMNILQNKENETTERLKEIEFPFGKIPIGINESISFFPIGLSLGFLICASLFVDTTLLRKNYHKYRLKKLEEKKELEEKIVLITPLWADPLTSLPYRITKLIILLSPLILFGVSIYFIIHSWQIIFNDKDFTGIFIGNSKNNMLLYLVSYIISLCLFIYGSWKIIQVIKNYKNFISH